MTNNTDNTSPILNNPYEEPKWHYDATLEGNLDYSRILQGRRPYSAYLTVMPNASAAYTHFAQNSRNIEYDRKKLLSSNK